MRRRTFITLISGGAVWATKARAEQALRTRRIGVIAGTSGTDPRLQTNVAAFRDALRKYGWVEGRNLRLDYRFGDAAIGRITSDAADLVRLAPDAILVQGTAGLDALRKQTNSLPIVFVQVSDPVSAGFVQSLPRPGGHITGFSNFEYTISGKWLDLLKQAAPAVSRVGSLLFREDPSSSRYMAPIEAAAPSFGVQSTNIDLADPIQIERAIDGLAGEPQGGLIIMPGPKSQLYRDLIITLAARHHLPAIYPYRFFATAGGLMSYGIEDTDPFRRAASYIDRILRGEKPGDLPVQAPTQYELVINLKTARALGLEVPATLLARADEVIE